MLQGPGRCDIAMRQAARGFKAEAVAKWFGRSHVNVRVTFVPVTKRSYRRRCERGDSEKAYGCHVSSIFHKYALSTAKDVCPGPSLKLHPKSGGTKAGLSHTLF